MADQRIIERQVAEVFPRVWRSVNGTLRRAITGEGTHHRTLVAQVAATLIVALITLRWGEGAAILLALLAASVSGLVDGRLSVALGLLCLACGPILLIGAQHTWLQQSTLVNYYISSAGINSLRSAAATLTTWAYYLLAIGLIGLIRSYVAQGRKTESVRDRTG